MVPKDKQPQEVGGAELRPQQKSEPEMLTPDEWARKIAGRVARPRIRISYQQPMWKTPRHRAAAACHGWEAHKQATVEPLKITRADYDAALKAAGDGFVHMSAVSPFHRSAAEAECKRLEKLGPNSGKARGKSD